MWSVAPMVAAVSVAILLGQPACDRRPRQAVETAAPVGRGDARPPGRWERLREAMVTEQLEARGVSDPRVLAAMRAVPRHEFVPVPDEHAYGDHPLPIGLDQTISQPYIVAFMTELAAPAPGARVLEIGTGSGYQAAVLVALGADVYSIEIIPELAERAAATLDRLGYRAHLRTGDGYRGWPEAAPFEVIIVTAAPPAIPQPLIDQLAVGGRMVIPVGDTYQELRVLTRTPDGIREQTVTAVAFVPMTGEAQRLDAGP